MSNTFSIEEITARLVKLNEQLEEKQKAANRILTEVENICREMIGLQEMIKSKQDAAGQNKPE